MSMLILLLLQLLSATNANSSEKLNIPNPSVKCGSCPCVNPCSQQALPPPSPPPPSPSITPPCPPTPQTPPPPRFIYVTSISTPPPPRFTYVTGGPPGNLYPTNDPFSLQVYSSNGGSQVVFESLQLTICSGLILGLIFLLF